MLVSIDQEALREKEGGMAYHKPYIFVWYIQGKQVYLLENTAKFEWYIYGF